MDTAKAHVAHNHPDWLPNALNYWECRRIAYNVVLTIVFILWVAPHWAQFRPFIHWPELLALVVLALLANLCYTAAYLVDVAVWHSTLREAWLKRRWTLWLAGTLFAVLLESYWVNDEILSPILIGK
jgi:hypothetical protein